MTLVKNESTQIQIPVSGTRVVEATVFEPSGEVRETILMAPALGVPQAFYSQFINFLQSQEFRVVSFDYRGIGRSQPQNYRNFDATMQQWVEDFNAAVEYCYELNGNKQIRVVCHSVSGQLLAMLEEPERIAAVISITAGSGYYRFNEAKPWTIRLFWFLIVPTVLPLFGYYPGKRIGIMDDLPRSIMSRWREWCLHPKYLLDQYDQPVTTGFERLKAPVLSFSFSDDWMISKAAVDDLSGRYPKVQRHHVTPQQAQLKKIGHFGFFKNNSDIKDFWLQCLSWLTTADHQSYEQFVLNGTQKN